MKRVNVVFADRSNPEAIRFILNNLNEIFEGYVEFDPVYFNELKSGEILEADAYITNPDLYYNGLRNHVDDFSLVVNLRRFPHSRARKMLAGIPKGTDVLIVNDRFASSIETSHQILDFPITDLNLIPYDPSQPDSTYSYIDTAVTMGEAHMVPHHIKNVIDIGYRLIGSDTILPLIYILGLDTEQIHRNMFRQFENLLERNRQNMENYVAYYLKSEMLSRVNESSPLATFLMDSHFRCLYANAKAREIIHVVDCREVQLQNYIDHGALKSDDTSNMAVEINSGDYIFDKYPIRIQDQILGYYMTLKEKTVASTEADALKQKGYYARYHFKDITYKSKKMDNVVAMAKRLAASDETVLIRGESGTGKELIAQSLHNYSARRAKPFVAVNCAALPESLLESELFGYEPGSFTGARSKGKVGLFEQANKGTIFLDEIGDVSPRLQARLLRTIQEMQVMKIGSDKVIDIDVRIIAATNKDLEAAIQEGTFRRDLFYRINVLPLIIPPLRERKDDILPLLKVFLGAGFKNVKDKEKEILVNHPWPGNARELRNVSHYYNSLHQLPEYLTESDAPKIKVGYISDPIPRDVYRGAGNRVHSESSYNSGYSGAYGSNWTGGPEYMNPDSGTSGEAKPFMALPSQHGEGTQSVPARFKLKPSEEEIKRTILSLIYQYTEPAHGIGRTTLVQLLRDAGISIGDGVLRNYLIDLRMENLIDVGLGRGGTRITEKGIMHLNEQSSI